MQSERVERWKIVLLVTQGIVAMLVLIFTVSGSLDDPITLVALVCFVALMGLVSWLSYVHIIVKARKKLK
jgi:hypothetical protein